MWGRYRLKPEYMGHTVNFRSHKLSYKDKTSIPNPKEDWLIFENTHEAISSSRKHGSLLSKLRKTPRRIDTIGEANPLTGLLTVRTAAQRCIIIVPEAVQKALRIRRISLTAPLLYTGTSEAWKGLLRALYCHKVCAYPDFGDNPPVSNFAISNREEFHREDTSRFTGQAGGGGQRCQTKAEQRP